MSGLGGGGAGVALLPAGLLAGVTGFWTAAGFTAAGETAEPDALAGLTPPGAAAGALAGGTVPFAGLLTGLLCPTWEIAPGGFGAGLTTGTAPAVGGF